MIKLFCLLFFVFLWCVEGHSTVTVHRVGAGNCITFEDPITRTYMIIDCGSSEFEGSINYKPPAWEESPQTPRTPLAIQKGVGLASTPTQSPKTDQATTPLTTKKITTRDKTSLTGKEQFPKKISKKNVLRDIRQSLGMIAKGQSIKIKTVFITHPDKDHYNWTHEVLGGEDDTVEHIVLGGDPLKYESAKYPNRGFIEWLEDRIESGKSQVYFLALNNENRQIKGWDHYTEVIRRLRAGENLWGDYSETINDLPFLSLGGVAPAEAEPQGASPSSASVVASAPRRSLPRKVKQKQAAKSSKRSASPSLPLPKAAPASQPAQASPFQVTLLGVNTLHAGNSSGLPSRLTYYREGDADDNADSFMVKISDLRTESSILLTGDATALNTRRLIDSGIDVSSSVLLASHHGSSSHGSNNLTWLNKVRPTWIVISSGLIHGHPAESTYGNFREIKFQGNKTNKHFMLSVAREKGEGSTDYIFHQRWTTRPVLSTLANGTLRASFAKTESGIEITADLIQETPLQEELSASPEDDVELDEVPLNASPKLEADEDALSEAIAKILERPARKKGTSVSPLETDSHSGTGTGEGSSQDE